MYDNDSVLHQCELDRELKKTNIPEDDNDVEDNSSQSRKIIFRAWDKEEKEMIDSFPYNNLQTDYFYARCNVMQYIGLQDKNDTKIFEGDIVKYIGEFHTVIGQIVFENGAIIIQSRNHNKNFKGWLLADARINVQKDWEVIGNIYENPEYLNSQLEDETRWLEGVLPKPTTNAQSHRIPPITPPMGRIHSSLL